MANFMRFDFQRGLWLNSTDGGQTFSEAANGLLKGTLANRPAAGLGRRFYFATDTAGLFYDNGTAWIPIARKFGGAHVYRSTAQTISNATFTFISWTSATYDTDSIWSSTYPQRLIVPSGVTRIRLSAGIRWPDKIGTTSEYGTWFAKNKTTASGGTGIVGCEFEHWTRADTAGRCGYSLVTPVLPVAGGDFFGLVVYQNTGDALLLVKAWMAMELIQ